MNTQRIADIVTFWMGPDPTDPDALYDRRDWWYKGGPDVDAEIRSRFGALVPQACERQLMDWQDTSMGALALILLLDQFTRNLYRNTKDAYRGDDCAFDVVTRAIGQGLDKDLPPVPRIWLYHPFHHSEDIAEQDRGIELLQALLAEAAPEWHRYVERSIWGWNRHRNIVAQFNRFPHRNAVLGRESTADELAFLETNSDSFGQGPK